MLDARPLICSSAEEDEVVVPPQTPPGEDGRVPPPPEKAQDCTGSRANEAEEKVANVKQDVDQQEEKNDKKGSGGGGGGLSGAGVAAEDWFGCSFCENRWFPKLSLLESHYGKEHEGATSYQFELLELKKCVIVLPHIKTVLMNIGTAAGETGEDLNKQFSEMTLSGGGGGGGGGGGKRKKRNRRTRLPPMIKAIRKAIKVTQGDGGGEWGKGSSYRRIKEYLINKMGMDADKLKRKLRRVLERFVEMGKLERRFCSGKTLYSLKRSEGQGDGEKMRQDEEIGRSKSTKREMMRMEDKRRFRDQQLKQLAKSLKPHDLMDHE